MSVTFYPGAKYNPFALYGIGDVEYCVKHKIGVVEVFNFWGEIDQIFESPFELNTTNSNCYAIMSAIGVAAELSGQMPGHVMLTLLDRADPPIVASATDYPKDPVTQAVLNVLAGKPNGDGDRVGGATVIDCTDRTPSRWEYYYSRLRAIAEECVRRDVMICWA